MVQEREEDHGMMNVLHKVMSRTYNHISELCGIVKHEKWRNTIMDITRSRT